MRDEDGNFIFETEGDLKEFTHDGSNLKSTKQGGYLYADDGTPIFATANREVSNPGSDTNCHGYTFGDGQYWINPDQVPDILVGDRYENVPEPKAGDVVVYFENGSAKHSAKVVDVRKKYNFLGFQFGPTVVEVEGISGIQTEIKRTTVEDAWSKTSHSAYFRKREE